jgi:hypothetical protein
MEFDMGMGSVFYEEKNIRLMEGSASLDLYRQYKAGNNVAKAKCDRLIEYGKKAEDCFYKADVIAKLRQEYSDVLP